MGRDYIMDFFVAAAVRKGAVKLPAQMQHRDTQCETIVHGNVYGTRCWCEKASGKFEFTVNCDGRWDYAAGTTVVSGKLQPPHAKSWIDKMLNKGIPGELARRTWEIYRKMRNGKS